MGDVAASYRGAIDGVMTDVSIAIEKLHGESGGGRMASRRRASPRLVSSRLVVIIMRRDDIPTN
jgi:hypothetical protein